MIRSTARASSPADRIFPFLKPRGPGLAGGSRPFDATLFFITLLLVFCGILMVFSSSAHLAKERYGDVYYFLKREVFYFVIGIAVLFTTKTLSYRHYARLVYPMLAATLLLMLLTFIPGLSHSAKGAPRWISLFGFTFQPSELTKLMVVIFTAYITAKKGAKIKSLVRGYLPIVGVAGVFILAIVVQKDLGSAFVLSAVVGLMLFVSGTPIKYLVGSVLLAAPAFVIMILSTGFRRQRILAFLDPWKYQQDSGFQIIQSFVAFKAGGFDGVGLAEGKQKLFYLPEAHTDFILSVVGEEFGMLGVLFVTAAFLFFVIQGIRIALRCQDPFGMMLAFGITCLIGLSAFINFGVVMGILPTKGLTLPFISYGGTSLIVYLAAVGILLNISTHVGEE